MANGLAVAPHCRVIVDNDYQGDPDGLVALAYHLLSPANRVTAVTSSFLNTRFPVASPRAEDGAVLARQLLEVVGGSSFEYNRDTDPAAAAFVFGQPELEIHQFPLETYRRCAYSVAELEHDLGGAGRLGYWLWEHFMNPPDWGSVGGVWPLGDSPTVLVTALSTESSTATLLPPEPAPVRHGGSTQMRTFASSSPTCSRGSGCTNESDDLKR